MASIAVVGAGAVGGYFGGMLARAGARVTMIGRPAFVEAVNRNGLFLDTLQFQESVRVQASAEISAAAGADIVLFCVKTTDNAPTAKELAPCWPAARWWSAFRMASTTSSRSAPRRI